MDSDQLCTPSFPTNVSVRSDLCDDTREEFTDKCVVNLCGDRVIIETTQWPITKQSLVTLNFLLTGSVLDAPSVKQH